MSYDQLDLFSRKHQYESRILDALQECIDKRINPLFIRGHRVDLTEVTLKWKAIPAPAIFALFGEENPTKDQEQWIIEYRGQSYPLHEVHEAIKHKVKLELTSE